MKIKTSALDRLFSQYIRTRDGFACRYSGRTDGIMDCAHILSRRHVWTRWDPDNAVCLSRRWHMHFTVEPFAWVDWVRSELGPDHVEMLQIRAASREKLTDAARAEIGERLIAGVRDMGEKPVCGLGRRLVKASKAKSKYKRKVTGEVVLR